MDGLWALIGCAPERANESRAKPKRFVGQLREVAWLSGFNVGRIRLQGFVIAGFASAIPGILFVGTNGSASVGTGADLLRRSHRPTYARAAA
jgi:hypothetical protein